MRWSSSGTSVRTNAISKHGFAFETATLVFSDPLYRSIKESEVDGEERWKAIGLVDGIHLLLVVHTIRDDHEEEVVGIISARKATRQESEFYEEGD